MIFERDSDDRFTSSSQPIKGGWGAVAFARLNNNHRGELITANNEDGTITIFFAN